MLLILVLSFSLLSKQLSKNSQIPYLALGNGTVRVAKTTSLLNSSAYVPTNSTSQATTPSTTLAATTIPYSQCFAEPGYLCLSPLLHSSTGNLTVGIGQTTGVNWRNVDIIFVAEQVPTYQGVPQLNWSARNVSHAANLLSGSSLNVTLPVTSKKLEPGTMINGTIWARYYLNGTNSTIHYTGMAAGEFVSS
jgi:hypothetical protein